MNAIQRVFFRPAQVRRGVARKKAPTKRPGLFAARALRLCLVLDFDVLVNELSVLPGLQVIEPRR